MAENISIKIERARLYRVISLFGDSIRLIDYMSFSNSLIKIILFMQLERE